MWKKIAIGGAIAAAALGSGTAALAASGSTTPGTPAASNSASAANGKHAGRAALRHALHGQFVTGKPGSTTFITHDLIRGQVSAVNGSSITVTAADHTSETFAVNSATKVRARSGGKGSASTIGAVHVGDKALVLGTGAGTALTATGIVDVGK
jgi:hypothetical protein